ncbi:MAG TPA: hypothetical protein VH396_15045 [Chitinophagaceae bacterium]
MKTIRFITILLGALTLAPLMAHLLELPNKMSLSRDAYLTVQSIYSGWNLLGIIEVATVVSSTVLFILTIKNEKPLRFIFFAFVCFDLALILFFSFTYPANRETDNWTRLPNNWQQLRNEWEYSHAARAGLYIIGLISLLSSGYAYKKIKPRVF